MITPTIHLNGTSPDRLMEDYGEVIQAHRKALELLCSASPNGRDYYPQGPDAIGQALREHDERVLRLHQTIGELERIRESIANRNTR